MDKKSAELIKVVLPLAIDLTGALIDALNSSKEDVPDYEELKELTQKLKELPDLE